MYNGKLVAAGGFTTAGGNPASKIAIWDGTSWSPLGSGIDGAVPGYGAASVASLAVYRGRLIVGGYFTLAGGKPASRIASWDGTTWEPLGSGMSGVNNDYAPVLGLAVYNNKLFAGGTFDTAGGAPVRKISRWDGSTWSRLGSGTSGRASALMEFDGKLAVGGSFLAAGNQPLGKIAAWTEVSGCGPVDTDGDGVFDLCDNCVQIVNPGQEDSDGDFAGNLCDNCPSLANAHQTDTDNNDVGDACEGVCPITITGDVNISGSITSADVITLGVVTAVESTLPFVSASVREASEAERVATAAGRQWRVEATLGADAPIGPLRDFLIVRTNHAQQAELQIPLSGVVRPVLHLTPGSAAFGELSLAGQARRMVLTLINFGTEPVEVRSVTASVEGVSARPEVVEAGKRWRGVVELAPTLPRGRVQGELRIETSSATMPELVVPLSARVD